MSRLIAISNRTAVDPNARAGGLAIALWEALNASGGAWAGWSGAICEGDPETQELSDDGVDFILTDLTQEEHDGYYHAYANRTLWPLFHYRTDLVSFDHDAFRIYSDVNRRLAEMVTERIAADDVVWVHDYHLLLFARYLREMGWTGRAGFFLHIPFPPPEVFTILPEHREVAEALCAHSVVGFQSERDRANFVRYLVEYCDGAETSDGKVNAFGSTTLIRAYPIGIDPQAFTQASVSEAARAAAHQIGSILNDRQLVIGVDRMDYSKGLPERFAAVGEFYDNYPEMRGRVSVTQIAPPSRSVVAEYRELREELDRLAGRVNGDHGDLDWIPLRYLARAYDRDQLAGLFRIARAGLVTPLRDGMNLVAKEFVMAQNPMDPGVLILSEFAGAAEQLHDALIVNPFDTRRVAEALHTALTMPLEERMDRWRSLKEVIMARDITWWRTTYLDDLSNTPS